MAETQELIEKRKDVSIQIEELKTQINDLKVLAGVAKPKMGNPAVVGLAGFGLTTLVLQFYNIGLMDDISPVVSLGLIFGGLAQMIAGLQEFSTGNNFGYSAFTTYGAFWIALALMKIGSQTGLYKVEEETVGYFLLAFTLYTFIMCIGAANISMALFIVFVLLFLGFFLLDIGHFGPKGANKAAGYVLIACALGAWYCMLHIIYGDVYGKDILPVGPAPVKLIRKYVRGQI